MTAILDLQGKKGLIVGIANEHSIAYPCTASDAITEDNRRGIGDSGIIIKGNPPTPPQTLS